MAVRLGLGVTMSMFVLIFSTLLLVVLSRGLRSRIRWSLGVATITALAFFQWLAFTSTGRTTAETLRLDFLSDVLPVLLGVELLWPAIRLAGDIVFAAVFVISSLGIVIAGVVAAAPRVNDSSEPVTAVAAVPGSPDVLLLVLNGYAGNEILTQEFRYDNTDLYTKREGLGFDVARDAKANYAFTYAAVSSMLKEGRHCGTGTVEPRPTDHSCPAAQRHPPASFQHDFVRQPEVPGGNCAARPEGRCPQLTVAHVILPHPPLILDAACNRQSDTNRRPLRVTDPGVLEERRPYYIDQLRCTNTTVLTSLTEILAERSDTVVVITGDHGSELTRGEKPHISEWTNAEIAPRMEIFSAYSLPNRDQAVYPSITPVNGMRAATNCAIDTGLDAVSDDMYWAPTDINGVVTDVGLRLTK